MFTLNVHKSESSNTPSSSLALVMADSYGTSIERLVREIAAGAGVPDFVFRPVDVRKGAAQREVGDALLWIGHQLVVVAVKARDPIASDSSERRNNWLDKNIGKAARQIEGTVRTLRNPPAGLLLRSERGVSIPWDPALVDEITGLVVVDHPSVGEYPTASLSAAVPTIAIHAQDWRLIHEELWSTAAVVKYVFWRARCELWLPLIAERAVFAAAIVAEADYNSESPPIVRVEPGLWDETRRTRRDLFFGTGDDDRYAALIDVMIAAAAEVDPVYSNVTSSRDYLSVTEFLDRIPPFHRVTISKAIIEKCQKVGRDGGRASLVAGTPSGMLVFVSDTADRKDRAAFLQALAIARHSQLTEASGRFDIVTLGIGTEPMPSAGRSHDFFLIQGSLELSTQAKEARDDLFGPLPQGAMALVAKLHDRSVGEQ